MPVVVKEAIGGEGGNNVMYTLDERKGDAWK